MPRLYSISIQQQTLFLMLGLPGSGKSVTGKAISNLTGATYIRSDQIMKRLFPEPKFIPEEFGKVIRVLLARIYNALEEGKSVVVDANNNQRSNRKRNRKIAQSRNAQLVVVYVQTPELIAKQRAQAQRDEQSYIFTDEVFERFRSRLQVPSEDEDYIIIDGTKPVEEQLRKLFTPVKL
ncbi:hypothetical protein CYG49_02100 [Candidatus Saccharibacteria bacterium]|nr:MAG: hypothetical protein CYG49_02100 [Candidatus Saccharibacteria bacterium]